MVSVKGGWVDIVVDIDPSRSGWDLGTSFDCVIESRASRASRRGHRGGAAVVIAMRILRRSISIQTHAHVGSNRGSGRKLGRSTEDASARVCKRECRTLTLLADDEQGCVEVMCRTPCPFGHTSIWCVRYAYTRTWRAVNLENRRSRAMIPLVDRPIPPTQSTTRAQARR